ncbi:MAG TPA: hypothetical protein VLQ76_02695, partial [Bacteroidales bacterium]|nr:hypothetical protein [Bacteroidales bacterium]
MRRVVLLYLAMLFVQQAFPQGQRALTIDDLTKWNRITEKAVSDDGSLTAFKAEPWTGDGVVTLYDKNAVLKATFNCATGISLTADSRFLIFTIKPPVATVTELKLKKTKKEDLPLDKLGIYDVAKGVTDTVPRLKSFKVPAKWAGWIAWQTEPLKEKAAPKVEAPPKENGEAKKETPEAKKDNGKKPKAESADNGYTLIIRNLISGATDSVRFVTEYIFVDEAEMLMCATTGDDKALEPGVLMIDLKKGTRTALYSGKARFKQLAADKTGVRAAFIASTDEKDKTGNTWSLYCWTGKGTAALAAAHGSAGIPEGWIVNENARLVFGEKSNRLFFGTSPEYKLKDTTILDEDRPNVDVWHYAEGKLHTAQLIAKSRDSKKTYMAVWHGDLNKAVQLATPEMPDVQLIDKGDAPSLLGSSNLPYELESMWEGNQKYDVWLVDPLTGASRILKEKLNARIRVSPAGKFLYWYQSSDSSWYSYDIAGTGEYRLTTPATLSCYDELTDVPELPDSYQPA